MFLPALTPPLPPIVRAVTYWIVLHLLLAPSLPIVPGWLDAEALGHLHRNALATHMSPSKSTRPCRRAVKVQRQFGHGQHNGNTLLALSSILTFLQAMNEDQRIDACLSSLTQIDDVLRNAPDSWPTYINLARTVIAHLDTTTFAQQPSRARERIWAITCLQRFAFADPDSAGVADIVAWCSRQWLAIVQRDPQNVAALRGIGQIWLSRAQPSLSMIHDEGSPASNNSSGRASRPQSGGSDGNDSPMSSNEAEQRAGLAEYVEARGYLLPATEYLERAVAAASAQDVASGELLVTAAEAYMSLGNTSSPRTNQRYFQRAVQLLRAASDVPNYSLRRHFQRYLDDYGRLLD